MDQLPEPWVTWNPKAYLREYHGTVKNDTRVTMRFLIDAVRRHATPADREALLEVGIGPALYGSLSIAKDFRELYLADLLLANLLELDAWLRAQPGAFDWTDHSRAVVELLNDKTIHVKDVESAVRSKVRALLTCDLRRDEPFGRILSGRFPTVMTLYCADSATNDIHSWYRLMQSVVSLLKSGGLCLFAGLLDCTRYKCGDHWFPSAGLSVAAVSDFFREAAFSQLALEAVRVNDQLGQGYDQVVLGCFRKRT